MYKSLNLLAKNIEHYASGSINELAKKAGVPQSTISRILNRETNPNLETIDKISFALNLKPSQLLSEPVTSPVPIDLINLLENQSDTVYETIRTMLHALNQQQKKKAR